ncbi:dihydroorotate dehydrogenase, partial [Acidithiobacillus sp. GGI-221]
MSYGLLRPLLFTLDPERAHTLSIAALEALGHMPRGLARVARRYTAHDPRLAQDFWGLHFANPVGLAAGYDKDARATAALPALGFGFIEIGTVTPRPQPGNPRPRVFRYPAQQAVINRMGSPVKGLRRLPEDWQHYLAIRCLSASISAKTRTPRWSGRRTTMSPRWSCSFTMATISASMSVHPTRRVCACCRVKKPYGDCSRPSPQPTSVWPYSISARPCLCSSRSHRIWTTMISTPSVSGLRHG